MPVRSAPKETVLITAERISEIGDYGLVKLGDKIKIFNNGTQPISDLLVGFPRQYQSQLKYFEATDNDTRKLRLEPDVNATAYIYWIRVNFARVLEFNQTYLFTLATTWANLVRPQSAGYAYEFARAPILTRNATSTNSTLVAPFGSDFKLPGNTTFKRTTVFGKPAIVESFKPLRSFFNSTFFVNYTSVNQFILSLRKVQRQIEFQPEGNLQITDMYSFFNHATPLSNLPIRMPRGSFDVMAYDRVGALWVTPRAVPQTSELSIQPRYGGGVKTNTTFSFTLQYTVARDLYVKQLSWWGLYNLTIAFASNPQFWIVEELEFVIIAPKGLEIESSTLTGGTRESLSAYDDRLVYRLQGLSPFHNLNFTLVYKYAPFWASLKPLSWLAIIEVAFVGLVAVARLRRPEEEKVPVPIEITRDFVDLYDEKIALKFELDRMTEDLTRGGLTKHEFRRRRKAIDTRIDELNKTLVGVKERLRKTHLRYDEMLRRMDRAEAEIDATRASENQIRGQYRAGRISRETYEHVVNDMNKRVDRAREVLETTIVTLREEAR